MDHQPFYEDKRSSSLATATLVLGTISLTCSCCIYLSVPCSALAIIFALLSRGGEMKMDKHGQMGLILGISGMVLTIVLFIFMFVYTILSMGGIQEFLDFYSNYMDQYMQYMQ